MYTSIRDDVCDYNEIGMFCLREKGACRNIYGSCSKFGSNTAAERATIALYTLGYIYV